jgi:hypothetical protein
LRKKWRFKRNEGRPDCLAIGKNGHRSNDPTDDRNRMNEPIRECEYLFT